MRGPQDSLSNSRFSVPYAPDAMQAGTCETHALTHVQQLQHQHQHQHQQHHSHYPPLLRPQQASVPRPLAQPRSQSLLLQLQSLARRLQSPLPTGLPAGRSVVLVRAGASSWGSAVVVHCTPPRPLAVANRTLTVTTNSRAPQSSQSQSPMMQFAHGGIAYALTSAHLVRPLLLPLPAPAEAAAAAVAAAEDDARAANEAGVNAESADDERAPETATVDAAVATQRRLLRAVSPRALRGRAQLPPAAALRVRVDPALWHACPAALQWAGPALAAPGGAPLWLPASLLWVAAGACDVALIAIRLPTPPPLPLPLQRAVAVTPSAPQSMPRSMPLAVPVPVLLPIASVPYAVSVVLPQSVLDLLSDISRGQSTGECEPFLLGDREQAWETWLSDVVCAAVASVPVCVCGYSTSDDPQTHDHEHSHTQSAQQFEHPLSQAAPSNACSSSAAAASVRVPVLARGQRVVTVGHPVLTPPPPPFLARDAHLQPHSHSLHPHSASGKIGAHALAAAATAAAAGSAGRAASSKGAAPPPLASLASPSALWRGAAWPAATTTAGTVARVTRLPAPRWAPLAAAALAATCPFHSALVRA